MVVVILVALLSIVDGVDYFVDNHTNCNNVYDAVPLIGHSTGYVTYLGIFDNVNDCINDCISRSNNTNRCLTYTYYNKYHNNNNSTSYAKQCYARFNYPLWLPYTQNQQNVDCGQIIWDCSSNLDCSLNGKCLNNGTCECNKGWKGYRCNQLSLLPANKISGYHLPNTSSWGGCILGDPQNKNMYHMFLSEFVNNCGLSTWTTNSQIVHATSTNGYNSQYTQKDVIDTPFSHEPSCAFAPNTNEYVIYYTYYNWSAHANSNYNSPCDECQGGVSLRCHGPTPYPLYLTAMRYASSMNGPWSELIPILNAQESNPTYGRSADSNLAGVILKNGTLIGMVRDGWTTTGMSNIHLIIADNWKDNKTYNAQWDQMLFPELTNEGTEDPFLYRDCNGNFHALFHNKQPLNDIGLDGTHAFSINGIDWIYGGFTYGNFVEFNDGTNFTFFTRERPHIIMDSKDNCTPIALTNGVERSQHNDSSYTLVQPIDH
eukprot:188466_1